MRFVQVWSWDHFAVARPRVKPGHPPLPLGGPDADARHAYGVKWSGPKRFFDQAKGVLNLIRLQLQNVRDDEIVWEPYEAFLWGDEELATPMVMAERHLWFARVPMIHFWMVEFHYPDRVMRQLGRMQIVPPPAPEPWETHEGNMLFKHKYNSHAHRPDWPAIHASHIQVIHFPLFQKHI